MSQDETLSALSELWALPKSDDVESFLRDLSLKIEKLWAENPHKLLNTLYRLDVSEAKLEGVMKNSTGAPFGRAIAELILEREVQKAKSRHSAN